MLNNIETISQLRTISELHDYVLGVIKESYAFFHSKVAEPFKSEREPYLSQESREEEAVNDFFALLDRMAALGVFPWGEVLEPTRTNILKSARKIILDKRQLNIDEGIRAVKEAAASSTSTMANKASSDDKLEAQLREIQEQLEVLKSMLAQLIEADRAKSLRAEQENPGESTVTSPTVCQQNDPGRDKIIFRPPVNSCPSVSSIPSKCSRVPLARRISPQCAPL